MKQIVFIFCCIVVAIALKGQSAENTVIVEAEAADSIENNQVVPLPEQSSPDVSNDSLKAEIEILRDSIEGLQRIIADRNSQIGELNARHRDRVNRLESQGRELNQKIAELIDQRDNTYLIVAENFLYLPYEEFNVERIAIPIYEKIQTEALRRDNNNILTLLSKYKTHILQLREYLNRQNEVMAKVAIQRPETSIMLEEFRSKTFYLDYASFPKWKDTYLGEIIYAVECKIIALGNGSERGAFNEWIAKLDRLNL